MELPDRGVVITGAGGGIGAAMARAMADRGARLVVADIDAQAAQSVAHETGGLAVVADVSTAAGVEHLHAAAVEQLGHIDLYCANAGIATEGGPEAADDLWQRTWEVNTLAHVRAVRLLLPQWLERGEGRLLATVSAAGLLMSLGSAPYSVTKHAALSFAEWLRATYAHRGIVVQALCPQGVVTPMLHNAGEAARRMLAADAVTPEAVAEQVIEALRSEEFLILPHPQVTDYCLARASDPTGWLSRMNGLQQRLEH